MKIQNLNKHKQEETLYRAILIIAAIAIPLFGFLASNTLPQAIEYPLHRWMLSAYSLSILAGSFFHPYIKKNLIQLTCWWLFIDHVWVTWIVYVNNFEIIYYSGLLTSLCALNITLRKPHLFYLFTITSILLGIAAAVLCKNPVINLTMILFTMVILGTAFMLSNIAIILFQNNLQMLNNELEKEVEKRAAVAERRAAQLAGKNQELEQFAYIASHDLKSPLRNIAGFAQLLKRKLKNNPEKEVLDYMDFIVGGVKRMDTVIHDVLRYSSFRDETSKFKNEEIGEIVQEAFSSLQWDIHEKQAIVYTDGVEGQVFCDRTQILQLFQNLISNSLKYNTSARPIIKVQMKRKEHETLFYVKDNGIGIAEEQHEKIFKMFQRLHTEKEFTGTGIGLAICKRIVENHQGTIGVESSIGEGSKFCFSISKNLKNAEYGDPTYQLLNQTAA